MTRGSRCFSDGGMDGVRALGWGDLRQRQNREALTDMEDFFLSHYLHRMTPLMGAASQSGAVLGPEPKPHPWSCLFLVILELWGFLLNSSVLIDFLCSL